MSGDAADTTILKMCFSSLDNYPIITNNTDVCSNRVVDFVRLDN